MKCLLTCLYLFFSYQFSLAQIKSIGIHSVINFSAQENDLLTSTRAIVQDNFGIMYFGTTKGITTFDGKNWNLIKLSNNSEIFSLEKDKHGRIYVGGLEEFGYLEANEIGQMVFVSLRNKLLEKNIILRNIQKIFIENENVIFISNVAIIFYDGASCKILEKADWFGMSYKVNDRIYVSKNNIEIKELVQNKTIPFLGSNQIDINKPFELFQWKKDQLMAIDNDKGCLLYAQNKFKLFVTDFSNFALQNKVSLVIKLRGGYLAIGSYLNGILIVDSTGLQINQINKDRGLENNHIISLYQDLQGNLWAGHEVGVSYIEISSPLTQLDFQIQSGGYAASVHQNKLYLGTTQGLYVKSWNTDSYKSFEANKTSRIENFFGQVWNQTEIKQNLYIGQNDGSYKVNENKVSKISQINGGWNFCELPNFPDYILQGNYGGLSLYKKEKDQLVFKHLIKGLDISCRIIEPDEDGSIWVSHGYLGVYRFRLKSSLDSLVNLKFYGKAKGFPSNLAINIFHIQNKLLFTSEYGGIYEYNSKLDSFVLNTDFAPYFGKYPKMSKLYQDAIGNIWFFELSRNGVLLKQKDNSYRLVEQVFRNINKPFIKGFELVYTIDPKNILFGTVNGFIHYDPSIIKDYNIPYKTLIRKVELIGQRDSCIFEGNKSTVTEHIHSIIKRNTFPRKNNSFRFSFAAPFFENTNKLRYSFYLEGFDKGWSDWSKKNEREYTNLPGGIYKFRVKSLNAYNIESNEDIYIFKVKPPWSKTWFAYFVYVLIVFTLIVLIVNLYASKKMRLYKKESYLKEKKIIELKNQQLNREIDFKTKELGSMTMKMVKRNEILINIKAKLEEMVNSNEQAIKNAIHFLIRTIDTDVNSDSDWDLLQINFDLVYNGFLKKLKENYPQLNTSELKLCAYIRMDIGNKEIAVLLNTTIRGIDGYRYRLRKKLDLNQEANLKDFLFNVF